MIKLDGDNQTIVPMRAGETGRLEVDEALFSLHERNVATAIQYRADILNALLSALVTA